MLKERLVEALEFSAKGEYKAETKVSYFTGKDKSRWRTGLASYNTVGCGEIYKDIELDLKAHGNNVEKIFTIKPGGNPENIRLKIEGARSLSVNDKGELEVVTGLGTVKFSTPVAYQENGEQKEPVLVAYNIDEKGYGFSLGKYDSKRPLIIDPLLASTFIGESGDDCVYDLTLDSSGNVYLTGYTFSYSYSTDFFPTTTMAYDSSHNGGYDVFISKLSGNLGKDKKTEKFKGDFNGDGNQDILWRNNQTGQVSVWLTNPSGIGVLSKVTLGAVADMAWEIK